MIYFVDEDVLQMRPYALELEIRGYAVQHLDNADDAFTRLSSVGDIQLVIFDVMLAVEEAGTSRFDRVRTRDFIRTGLVLLEDLVLVRPEIFPVKSVIFSMASQEWLLAEIDRAARKYKIEFLRKKDFGSPFAFGDRVDKLVRAI